jgi:hydrogenase maturation protease
MIVVIGVGNAWRGDDGAGLEVARRIAARPPEGVRVVVQQRDQICLFEVWDEADDAVIVDAASSGAPPGTIHRYDAGGGPLPARLSRSSTHAFGVVEAIELCRALGRLPRSLTVYAIEGESFEVGGEPTRQVQRAVARLTRELTSGARRPGRATSS